MKLTFKVCLPTSASLAEFSTGNANAQRQDLKQQKFLIEAEPSDTVSL